MKILFDPQSRFFYNGHLARKTTRYLIAGGTAAAVDLSFLYFFTSILHIWYLASAAFAFLIAFGVSFTLQKFWTFKDSSTDKIKSQMGIYLLVTTFNLGLNTLLMFLFVDGFGLPYLLAQVIASGIVAIQSFFTYQRFVFRTSQNNLP